MFDPREFVARAPWRFARTMPDNPHEYTVRSQTPVEDFEAFVVYIREYGYRSKYAGRWYTYLNLDGWRYWTMGAPLDKTIIINRARLEERVPKYRFPYHTALSTGTLETATPQDSFVIGDSVAFVHDLMKGPLPSQFMTCDVIYSDPPWPAGYRVFNDRAGIDSGSYDDFLAALSNAVSSLNAPVLLSAGRPMLRKLPKPDQIIATTLNGESCSVVVYRTELPFESIPTTVGLLGRLAKTYSRVGDFCCGYGLTGRIFLSQGKSFVMSDHNPLCIGYIAEHAHEWMR